MIRALRVSNFKAIKTSMGDIPISDVCILSGANSSGKSSLIQSILLIAQTLGGLDSSTPLILNGELVSLGKAPDLWHGGDMNVPLGISIRFSPPSAPNAECLVDFEFRANSDSSIYLDKCTLGWSNNIESDGYYPEELTVQLKDDVPIVNSVSQEVAAEWVNELSQKRLHQFPITPVGQSVRLSYSFPSRIYFQAAREAGSLTWYDLIVSPLENTTVDFPQYYDTQITEDNQRKIQIALGQYQAVTGDSLAQIRWEPDYLYKQYFEWVRTSLSGAQLSQLASILANLYGGVPLEAVDESHKLGFTEKVLWSNITLFTERLRYLGANRIAPTALFDLKNPCIWAEVGIDGSNVAAALAKHRLHEVQYWQPTGRRIQSGTLLSAVLDWLKYFELVSELETADYDKLGTFLSVKPHDLDKRMDLTALGFGTSQILPILVQGLLTPRPGIFIVEQPEVHLHPKLQSRLGYFFFGLAQVGIQCIIETHSEHIIDQFRLVIAEDTRDSFAESTSIYFVTRTQKKGAVFSSVNINRYGSIENWPKDFMDQSTKIAQEILAAAKRRRTSR